MFEEELELEKESKSLSLKSPFLYIFLVVILIIGGVAYFIATSQKDLSTEQAKAVLSQTMKQRGPAYVHFRVGNVKASVNEKPRDPHYKLLENAGFLKLANSKNNAVQVTLTPLGEGTFSRLPEFRKASQPDGTQAFDVPLANREVAEITSIKMVNPSTATVEYTWKWKPTKVGELFDASGPAVKKFNTYERATLIKDHGADFYHETQKATVTMVRSGKSWQISTE